MNCVCVSFELTLALSLQSPLLCAPCGSEGHQLRGGAVLNVLHTSVANSVCYQSIYEV